MTTTVVELPILPSGGGAAVPAAVRGRIRGYARALTEMGLAPVNATGALNVAEDFVVPETSYNTAFGYVVFAFADSLSATHPLYLKFDFMTGGSAIAGVMMTLDVGSAVDAAGLITKRIMQQPVALGNVSSVDALLAARRLLGCHTDGFAGVCMAHPTGGNNGSTISPGAFTVNRTVDSNGNATGQGVFITVGPGSPSEGAHFFCARWTEHGYITTVNAFVNTSQVIYQPFGAYITVDGEIPTYLVSGLFPDVQPIKGLIGIWCNSMSFMDTFKVAIVGNTPRTYINPGNNGLYYNDANAGAYKKAGFAMLWE